MCLSFLRTLIFVYQAIEYVNPDQQAMIVQELAPSVLRCVKDANGNHVGLSCLYGRSALQY